MMKFEEHGREWLNPADSYENGYIKWDVCVESYGENHLSGVDATLSIADCNRVVSLEFNSFSKETFKQRIGKVDLLIQELNKFKSTMHEALDAIPGANTWLERD